jgi:hypothetical protein
MKKIWIGILLAACLTALLSGCAEERTEPASGDEAGTPEVVVFTDPVLESMVREKMGKPEGDITAAEAEAVKELSLNIEWQPEIPPETRIKDLHGLESFKNLEMLDLSFHDISDISPLAGLTKLTSLSLGGNTVADLSPLSGLTDLKWLTIFNSQAEDYSPLENLTNLEGLMAGDSTISDVSVLSGLTNLNRLSLVRAGVSDVSPLAGLTNLRALYLEGCPITDYSPLAEIYPLLEEKDFTMVTSLSELGFVPSTTARKCLSNMERPRSRSAARNGIRRMRMQKTMSLFLSRRKAAGVLAVYYTPDTQTYDFNWIISAAKRPDILTTRRRDLRFRNQSQQDVEELLTSILGEPENGDLLASPAANFNETIFAACGINADVLCALPKEFVTLTGLGFQNLIESDGVCTYRDENDPALTISVHHPEWNNIEWNVEYTFPVNGYSVRVWYYESEPRFFVRAKAADGTSADYEYRIAENQYNNGMAPEGMTSEDYFAGIYGDPAPESVFGEAIRRMEQEIGDRFGMSIDELYALPAGE